MRCYSRAWCLQPPLPPAHLALYQPLVIPPGPSLAPAPQNNNQQERIQAAKPRAIILSGGPNSVRLEGAPRVPDGFFEYCQEQGIAVMGICYGMQVGGWVGAMSR
jgi:hypothetical protein